MTLDNYIYNIQMDIKQCEIYNHQYLAKEKKILLAMLLELKEHRKTLGISFLDKEI